MRVVSWIMTLFLSGCATRGEVIKEVPLGLSEIRKIIVSVVGEAQVDATGRELVSKYFDARGSSAEEARSGKERMYTKVFIAGDRRPYDIYVDVIVEVRNTNGGYSKAGINVPETERVSKKIRERLNQSLEKRNLIDDFRPF
ncbi:MAG: hypothetical protein N2578_00605 [Bdellovibrionaceae bacterium]|nr:hypothetical protein [Pseudobdellovibrionaceae bacterium]